ncbi:hypothetical protein FIU88_04820 [Halomonas sp. THAF12]|uniref:DUF6119 family protein n=1 Tax=Halomonas sp. THAF12 TaxID=2587849 RepID=UPI0012A912B4|nr:DUF6119 family protein [Halomonas sp. THAF12]QFT84297.1 hypothetical protein FIU88_04820 [Halomonas sp. THAF12]
MNKKTQKLTIRLLKEGVAPEQSLREGVQLQSWEAIKGSKIAITSIGGGNPKWANFLELNADQAELLVNWSACGIVFLRTRERWFGLTFGLGHVKLEPTCFEEDFGLKVVLNSVNHQRLRSADLRTPDENTVSRRSQASRSADQNIFSIDAERDIVRGLAGIPKLEGFGSRVAGADSLSLTRKVKASELPRVCREAYDYYKKDDYKEHFEWVDYIRHVRDAELLGRLERSLVDSMDKTLKDEGEIDISLAYPAIYDPEKTTDIMFKGFGSKELFPDLEAESYFEALRDVGVEDYYFDFLRSHTVNEVDDAGKNIGNKWPMLHCLSAQQELDGRKYVLSGGKWYQIDQVLADDVNNFFERVEKYAMPLGKKDDNEEVYNARLRDTSNEHLCMDRRLVTPTGSKDTIEACDFFTKESCLIHVKNKAESSRLSHLFSQGVVSGTVLVMDEPFRNKYHAKMKIAEEETAREGFSEVFAKNIEKFSASDFKVVYAVIGTGVEPKLPFFSLVTFKQAAKQLELMGYNVAFSWISKPKSDPKPKAKKRKGKN